MSANRGTIVLMGSGELTATMVELHKSVLRPYGPHAKASFIDTPAGFQLNVDQITQKAVAYFKDRVQHTLAPASYKGALGQDTAVSVPTLAGLRKADYILIGPGSPTYALEQWGQSPIPRLLKRHIEKGGCLVAASAAALTMGRLTLPVYEIYKVGQAPHWADGLDILGAFGFNLVVFPHWNNAEGGNHDTRYCFMGEQRMLALEKQMPPSLQILGLDEHTALIIDLDQPHARVYGVGCVTLRRGGEAFVFNKGDRVPLALLRGCDDAGDEPAPSNRGDRPDRQPEESAAQAHIWDVLHALDDRIQNAQDQGDDPGMASLLLDMERQLWQSRELLEEHEGLGAARELFRERLALMAVHPDDRGNCLAPLVESLIKLRNDFRKTKKWEEADAIRHCLQKAGVEVEDTPSGSRWKQGNCK